MSKEMDEMRERIFKFFTEDDWEANIWELTKQILSLQTPTCRLAVVSLKAELPTRKPLGSITNAEAQNWINGYRWCRQDMLQANFVQEVTE